MEIDKDEKYAERDELEYIDDEQKKMWPRNITPQYGPYGLAVPHAEKESKHDCKSPYRARFFRTFPVHAFTLHGRIVALVSQSHVSSAQRAASAKLSKGSDSFSFLPVWRLMISTTYAVTVRPP